MRVLHVIPAVAPRYGGPSHAVVGMCQALLSSGVDVLIATTNADGPQRLPVVLGEETTYLGIPTIFFPRQWSESYMFSHPLARWLDQNVGAFDVVHAHYVFGHASIAASLACRRHGVPYIVRPLGTLVPWSLRQKRWRKRLFWHLGVKQMLRRAAAIHYTTAEERRLAESTLHLSRGVVVPLGIGEDLVAEPADPGALRRRFPALGEQGYVLSLSRLHPKKGLELLIEAFLDVTTGGDLDGWRLVIAGDGDPAYVAGLKRLAAARSGGERVLFSGWIAGAEKAAAFHGAALFALPSHQENFGVSVAEALVCRVPVLISTEVNLADDVAAAGAGWIVPIQRQAVAQALEEALRDEGERRRRGEAGRRLALDRFTWPQIGAALSDLYRSLTTGSPAVPPAAPAAAERHSP